MDARNVKPNITHYMLARLEKLGKLDKIITQNIDGLHQMAGSTNVIELHGATTRNYCENAVKSIRQIIYLRAGKQFQDVLSVTI